VYLLECLTERKRPAARPLLFIALSLGGAILVLTQGDPAKFTGAATPGDWIVWGCVLSWVTYTLLSRKAVAQFPAAGVSVWSVLIGTAMVFAGDAVTSQAAWAEAPARVWWAAAYLGLGGTAIAFSLYLKGIRAVGPTRASIFINLVPVFGVLASVAAGRETLTGPTLAGGALVIAGVYGLNRWR
jgi:drug/metabolite transporter (DMT)-like permease